MFLRKIFSNRFLLIMANTASICILFMIYYTRKDSVVLTRTFSYMVISPISEVEIADFLENFETPKKVVIKLKDTRVLSYQQKFVFELKFYDVKSDDELVDKFLKEFEFFFQIKLITKNLLKEKKFPQVIFDTRSSTFHIVKSNDYNQRVPTIVSLKSTSASADGIKVFNAYKEDKSEMLQISDGMRIFVIGKKNKEDLDKGISLLSINFEDKFVFFEVINIK